MSAYTLIEVYDSLQINHTDLKAMYAKTKLWTKLSKKYRTFLIFNNFSLGVVIKFKTVFVSIVKTEDDLCSVAVWNTNGEKEFIDIPLDTKQMNKKIQLVEEFVNKLAI